MLLGIFTRHLFQRAFASIVLTGFTISLAIELTQITGLWFLYPCPYRLFDVDDLIANTLSAMLAARSHPACGSFRTSTAARTRELRARSLAAAECWA